MASQRDLRASFIGASSLPQPRRTARVRRHDGHTFLPRPLRNAIRRLQPSWSDACASLHRHSQSCIDLSDVLFGIARHELIDSLSIRVVVLSFRHVENTKMKRHGRHRWWQGGGLGRTDGRDGRPPPRTRRGRAKDACAAASSSIARVVVSLHRQFLGRGTDTRGGRWCHPRTCSSTVSVAIRLDPVSTETTHVFLSQSIETHVKLLSDPSSTTNVGFEWMGSLDVLVWRHPVPSGSTTCRSTKAGDLHRIVRPWLPHRSWIRLLLRILLHPPFICSNRRSNP